MHPSNPTTIHVRVNVLFPIQEILLPSRAILLTVRIVEIIRLDPVNVVRLQVPDIDCLIGSEITLAHALSGFQKARTIVRPYRQFANRANAYRNLLIFQWSSWLRLSLLLDTEGRVGTIPLDTSSDCNTKSSII